MRICSANVDTCQEISCIQRPRVCGWRCVSCGIARNQSAAFGGTSLQRDLTRYWVGIESGDHEIGARCNLNINRIAHRGTTRVDRDSFRTLESYVRADLTCRQAHRPDLECGLAIEVRKSQTY